MVSWHTHTPTRLLFLYYMLLTLHHAFLCTLPFPVSVLLPCTTRCSSRLNLLYRQDKDGTSSSILPACAWHSAALDTCRMPVSTTVLLLTNASPSLSNNSSPTFSSLLYTCLLLLSPPLHYAIGHGPGDSDRQTTCFCCTHGFAFYSFPQPCTLPQHARRCCY